MKINKTTYLLLFIIILNSCAILKTDKLIDGQIKLTKENIELINGKYSRASLDHHEKQEGDLFWNFYTRGYNVGADSLCGYYTLTDPPFPFHSDPSIPRQTDPTFPR